MSGFRDAISNQDARAVFGELDEWMRATGTPWTRVASHIGVTDAVRHRVLGEGRGLLRANAAAIRAVIRDFPDGLADPRGRNDFLTAAQAAVLANEIRAWLARTGTPLDVLAKAAHRQPGGLMRLLDFPQPVGRSTAAAYRALMAANPDRYQPPKHSRARKLAAPVNVVVPGIDPLADRRGEADRRRREWIAQQAAEHQRKYNRPMGRSIEEMVA